MALFIGVHNMSGITDDIAQQSWSAYKEACTRLGGNPKHTHYSLEKGKAFCLTEASSADIVQKGHDEANIPISEIIEVKELQ